MEENRKEERTGRDMKERRSRRKGEKKRQKRREACQCIIILKKYGKQDLPDFTT